MLRKKSMYFCFFLAKIGTSKATMEEAVSDGMLALASTFIALYCTVFLVVIIYVCWKNTHEYVYQVCKMLENGTCVS